MEKKNQLLHAAWQIFNQQGLHATGVEQLREALGISKKTLYRYFASKEQLINAVLEYRDQFFLTRLQEFMQGHQGQSAMLSYLDFLQQWVQQEDYCGCSFINACAEFSDAHSLPHRIAKQHKAKIATILATHAIPAPQLSQLMIIGEGLIVSCQVSGYQAQMFALCKDLLLAAYPQQTGF
jgi:AcrR family transcriptional regulator